MFKKDILLIINPNASKGKGRKRANEIKQSFNEHGRHCIVAYTNAPGHACLLAGKGVRYGYKTIIAAGGDGTVNEVLNGIMSAEGHDGVSMGIIPIGRGNDFAWFAGIPCNIEKAVSLITMNEGKPVDVGLCSGTGHEDGVYFFNGAGFGFEPLVDFRAMGYRHLNGMPSYIVAFFYILFHFPKPYHVKLTIDGSQLVLDTQQISVCNGRRMGSAFIMAPKATFKDGLFDVMYAKKPFFTIWEIIKAVLKFLKGAQVYDSETFSYVNARKVSIEVINGGIEAHCDGEVFSRNGKHFDLEVLPRALKLIHGKEKRAL